MVDGSNLGEQLRSVKDVWTGFRSEVVQYGDCAVMKLPVSDDSNKSMWTVVFGQGLHPNSETGLMLGLISRVGTLEYGQLSTDQVESMRYGVENLHLPPMVAVHGVMNKGLTKEGLEELYGKPESEEILTLVALMGPARVGKSMFARWMEIKYGMPTVSLDGYGAVTLDEFRKAQSIEELVNFKLSERQESKKWDAFEALEELARQFEGGKRPEYLLVDTPGYHIRDDGSMARPIVATDIMCKYGMVAVDMARYGGEPEEDRWPIMRDGSVDLNVLEEYGQSLLAGLEDAKTEAELQKQAFLELCKATTLIEIGEPFLEYRELLSACLDLVPKQLTDKGYVSKVVAGTEVVAGIEGPRYLDPSKKYYWDKRVLESEDLTGGSIIIPPKYLDVLNEEKYRFPLGLDVVDTERYISIEHIPAIFFHEAGHGFYLYLRNNNPEDLYKLVVIKRRLSELAGDYQLDLANEGMSYEEAWNKIVLEGAPFLYSGINAEFHGCHVRVFSDGEGEDGTFLQGDEFVAEMFASYLLERERIVEFALTLPTEQRDLYTGNDGLISILDRLIERTQIMTKREAVRRHVDSLKETQRGVLLDCVNETEDRDLAKKYDQIYGEEARLAD